MDDSTFDTWTRRSVGLAAGGALGTLLGLLGLGETESKNNKKRRRRKRKRKQQRRQQRRNQNQNPNPPPPPCQGDCDRPDIILINVDDMRQHDYLALTRTMSLLANQGTTYPNYVMTTPLCAPSRASLFRGQYAHNTGVLRNGPPNGGWATFNGNGDDQSTIAVWLRQATPSYRTAFIGKYLNGYRNARNAVAPGWSDWVVPVPVAFYDYKLNVNGESESYGNKPKDYLTDVMAKKAEAIIASTPATTPLFMYFAPKSPHGPATPAPRHEGDFANHQLEQTGSFNEADMSDKPQYMQRGPFTAAEIADIQDLDRLRLESLLSVDQAVEKIVNALESADRLARAYIFFVTDNGYLLGEHRRTAKLVPYEEAVRMSMLVRGPDVPRGQTNNAMVANIDLAPTIAALAKATPPGFVDGRSFAATFTGAASERQALLLETFGGEETDPEELEASEALRVLANAAPVPGYRAIRTADRLYVEYQNTQEKELYDLGGDPTQMQSQHANPAYATEMADLSAWLQTLRNCEAAECRTAENAPP